MILIEWRRPGDRGGLLKHALTGRGGRLFPAITEWRIMMSLDPDNATEAGEGTPEDHEQHVVTLRIRRRIVGGRLDKYLHGRFPRMSRTALQRLIKVGAVTVNGMPTKASYEPNKGDVVEVLVPPPPPTDIVAEDIPIEILYEDDHLLALNKRPGIICHPAGYGQTGTIVNGLAHYARTLSHGEDPFRPGIVHRLDKNTTGVMLVAKSDETHWRLSLQFERRTIQKTYVAIVEGRVNFDSDIIDQPLGAHPTVKDRYVVPGRDLRNMATKEAITHYSVLRRFRGFTFVELRPKTGRTHQLRVHMSAIGHPMIGDSHYGGHFVSACDLSGGGSTEPLIDHQCLHARRIRFRHPIREVPMTIEAPLPERFRHILELLETHRSLEHRDANR